MTPKDLKTGHICKHRDGRLSMVTRNTCENEDNIIFASNNRTGLGTFNSDFTWFNNETEHEKGVAIIEVWEPFNVCDTIEIFTSKNMPIDARKIWEKEKIEEMTLSEICKELGRKIKIIE